MISFPIQPELPQKRQEVLEIILRLEKIDTVIELNSPRVPNRKEKSTYRGHFASP